jgi:hypothetical protein
MPTRITPLHRFPDEFEILLIEAGKKLVSISFPDATSCAAFRYKFYDYMKTIRLTDARPHLRPLALRVAITHKKKERRLEIGAEQSHWESGVILAALGLSNAEIEGMEAAKVAPVVLPNAAALPLTNPQEALREKLAEIRARREKEREQLE